MFTASPYYNTCIYIYYCCVKNAYMFGLNEHTFLNFCLENNINS